MDVTARDRMDYDVVIVGGGPAGLAAAIRLKQQAAAAGTKITVCLVEKGAQIGAHTLSGAVLDPASLLRLLPKAHESAPLETAVTSDDMYFLTQRHAFLLPQRLMPPQISNRGTYVISVSRLCRWLAQEAEALGVEIYPGLAAAAPIFDEAGALRGIVTGDVGRGRNGAPKSTFAPGMELTGKYTLLAEGARGFLSERIIARYRLRQACEPQKYGLGLKEVWEIPAARHRPGLVLHTLGWPLGHRTGGGLFLYHWGRQLVSVGMVVHLDYANPYLSPFEEFQRAKDHPLIARHLEGGKRLEYGARAVTEGGWQSVPKLVFPGGALIGCAAGFLNVPRIKGLHNAVASGMAAGEAAAAAIATGRSGDELRDYETAMRTGAVAQDLKPVRNVKPLWSRFGLYAGLTLAGTDLWCQALFSASPFGTLKHGKPDYATLKPVRRCRPIAYPKADGRLRFDLASSVYLSSTAHIDDQPGHLRLTDANIPLSVNLPEYDEPARRYCPAGVYEIVETAGGPKFQINPANCLHCKTCEIKDPAQNIAWTPPEGGGGPNYVDM